MDQEDICLKCSGRVCYLLAIRVMNPLEHSAEVSVSQHIFHLVEVFQRSWKTEEGAIYFSCLELTSISNIRTAQIKTHLYWAHSQKLQVQVSAREPLCSGAQMVPGQALVQGLKVGSLMVFETPHLPVCSRGKAALWPSMLSWRTHGFCFSCCLVCYFLYWGKTNEENIKNILLQTIKYYYTIFPSLPYIAFT